MRQYAKNVINAAGRALGEHVVHLELAMLAPLLAMIRKRGRRGAGGVQIAQRRNHGVPCLRIGATALTIRAIARV